MMKGEKVKYHCAVLTRRSFGSHYQMASLHCALKYIIYMVQLCVRCLSFHIPVYEIDFSKVAAFGTFADVRYLSDIFAHNIVQKLIIIDFCCPGTIYAFPVNVSASEQIKFCPSLNLPLLTRHDSTASTVNS